MKKLDFKILTRKEFYYKGLAAKIRPYGRKVTDFANLLGARNDGHFWVESGSGSIGFVNFSDSCPESDTDPTKRSIGARPAFFWSSISQIFGNTVRGENKIFEVEYGEYPQDIVLKDFAQKLENAYLNGTISETGKSYTTDSVTYGPFKARKHIEYEYNGKKYIRFEGNSYSELPLPDGIYSNEGKCYWLEVKPIEWLVYEEANIAISKKIILGGLALTPGRFTYDGEYVAGCYGLPRFLNEIFAKDIIPRVIDKKVGQSETVVNSTDADSIEAFIKQTEDENEQIRARIKVKEQLQQELKKVQEENARLIAKEAELNAQLEQMQAENEGKGQYVKQ